MAHPLRALLRASPRSVPLPAARCPWVSAHRQPVLFESLAPPRRYKSSSNRTFPAWFVRGGTSNGLVIHRDALPPEPEWHTVLPRAMGSPDTYGRQLDGMGSGVSSTSKIV
ncbi:PrpF domain-containing protein, partial [Microbacterium sp. T2.11-28]|uniref:PrpF domain-containing protein n=1 Tax=Microbacterium sp. T2.11-28 TaxID=3041169 RepID=UPI0025402AE4